MTEGVFKKLHKKKKSKNKNALKVLLINNLQGPLAKQITAEILHHVKNLNLHGQFVDDHFLIASWKAFKDPVCFTSSGTSSHTLSDFEMLIFCHYK